jgi:sugar phosphate isomerase/epimerase
MLLHENCEGWGGLSGTNARRFIESVDHPSVRYLFDIGNTVSYGQETMPFYREILPFVEYVHIKDCRRNPEGGKSSAFTYAGEGDALVREILTDLIARGYKAGVSIEPHVASIVHLGEGTKASPQERFDSYVRYGKGLEKLLAGIPAR